MTFKEIWAALINLSEKSTSPNKNKILTLIACEFFRIAYMIDYKKIPTTTYYTNLNFKKKKSSKILLSEPYLKYIPNEEVIKLIETEFPTICGISWTAFFYYNDLIAQNEDCKYYHKAEIYPKKRNKKIITPTEYLNNGVGRVNTMSTYIAILAYLSNEYPLENLLSQFSTKRGIASLTIKETNKFSNNFMSENQLSLFD